MSEILNLDDLSTIPPDTKSVELPVLSEKLGKEVSVTIKKIAPMDLLRVYNIPMDEINALVGREDIAEKAGALMEEQIKAFDVEDYQKMIASVIREGVTEPEPTDVFMKHSAGDAMKLFSDIMKFTTEGMDPEDTARFCENGELGGD